MTSPTQEKLQRVMADVGDSTDLRTLSKAIDSFADEADDPKARKRRRILRAANDCFVQFGYRRTSIDEVARTAHVAKGTVYLYFKSKADLLATTIAEEKVRYARQLQPLLQTERPAAERLRLWLEIALTMSAELPLLARLLSGDSELLSVLDDMDEAMGVQTTELQLTFLSSLIDEANAPHHWSPAEIRERAQVVLSLVYVSGNFADDGPRFGLSLKRHAELLADILVEGIAAEAARESIEPSLSPSASSGETQ